MTDEQRATFARAFATALRQAPYVEVDVNPMSGSASAPYPDWLFQAGFDLGRAMEREEQAEPTPTHTPAAQRELERSALRNPYGKDPHVARALRAQER